MEEIIIWDDDAARIQRMVAATSTAVRTLGLQLRVGSNCEPPLLARNNLYGKTPALEFRGHFWSKQPPCEFNVDEVEKLLQKLLP